MIHTLLQILSGYLVLIGTWRLANSTEKKPRLAELRQYQHEEETYNPLKDLLAIKDIFLWMFWTVKEFRTPGYVNEAVICHKKLNWGLLWLMSGILLQIVLYGFT